MPSLMPCPLLDLETMSPIAKRTRKSLLEKKIKKKEQFEIKRRAVSHNRIRNFRTGTEQTVERELPEGESFFDFFVTDYVVDGFTAPTRQGRLIEVEVNWLADQGTPKRGNDQKGQRVNRRPLSTLGKQFQAVLGDQRAPVDSSQPTK